MNKKYICLLLDCLIIIALLSASCTISTPKQETSAPPAEEPVLPDEGKQTVETETEESSIKEAVIQEESSAHLDVEGSIAGWLPENADNVSQSIADLVPDDLSFVRSFVAKAVKTIIMTALELDIEHIEALDGDDRYSARVGLGFPILIDLPIVGKRDYWIMVSFDFVVEEGEVVDANIDASSFEMKEVTEQDEEDESSEAVTMEIIPIERIGESYHYRTVLKEQKGVSVTLNALIREFVENGYVWTGDREFILNRVGSYTIPANGEFIWETSFDLSEVRDYFNKHGEATYRESWNGIDDNGKSVSVTFSVSTNDF